MKGYMWPADRAVERLADWICRSKSPQQVGARYRSACSREFVANDYHYSKLAGARRRALTQIAIVKGVKP